MTCLSLPGKIAQAIHLKRNPGHQGASNRNALGITCYYCVTCGYPIDTPEDWAATTRQPPANPK